jgi:tetratricopeptide (TPR) repeat protein
MPVEESADMLLMVASCSKADGDYTLAKENLDLLEQWCRYLQEFGDDPGEQLCTDDFAGHLARNVNLSAKAILGIAAFGQILQALGQAEKAEDYFRQAKEMMESWLVRADAGGYTRLAFGADGWSMKYNLVWDKLLGLDLISDAFYEKEIASYLPRMERYGLPLDSRAPYSKTDWILWTAALATEEAFPKFVGPVADYLRQTDTRVPFSDYYDTETGRYEKFIARSVQGGLFMPLLMDRWTKQVR